MVDIFRKELEKGYNLLCDVIILENYEEDGLVYNNIEIVKHINIKCSLSHKVYYPTIQTEIGNANMMIKLFTYPEIDIPINSKIVIKLGEKTTKYKASSVSAIYDTHQEILLELDVDV